MLCFRLGLTARGLGKARFGFQVKKAALNSRIYTRISASSLLHLVQNLSLYYTAPRHLSNRLPATVKECDCGFLFCSSLSRASRNDGDVRLLSYKYVPSSCRFRGPAERLSIPIKLSLITLVFRGLSALVFCWSMGRDESP